MDNLNIALFVTLCFICFFNITEGLNGSSCRNEGSVQKDPDNKCMKCTCKNMIFVCKQRKCRVLDCPSSEIVQRPGHCCPKCRKQKPKQCRGKRVNFYKHGQKWNKNKCTSCHCLFGKIKCTKEECPILRCKSNEFAARKNGECCETCVKHSMPCTVFGGRHIRSFDGQVFEVKDHTEYTLIKPSKSTDFQIDILSNAETGYPELSVKVNNVRVKVIDSKHVTVDNNAVTLPYQHGKQFSLSHDNGLVFQIGTSVRITLSKGYLEVFAPGFESNVEGLCGNFNGQSEDDFIGKDGVMHLSEHKFAQTWHIGRNLRSLESYVKDNKCWESAKKQRMGKLLCGVLYDIQFSTCRPVVEVRQYYSSCLKEVCNEKSPHPASIMAYYRTCERSGLKMEAAKNAVTNGQRCPRGAIYETCVTSCERTCADKTGSQCSIPPTCISGCRCKPGRLLHDYKCIKEKRCPQPHYRK